MVKWVEKDSKKRNVFWPSKELKKKAWMSDKNIYKKATRNPKKFWADLSWKGLDWFKKWNKIYVSKPPYFKWFIGGKINACYNCVDRHADSWRKNKAAIIWEPERLEEKHRIITYQDLYREVNKFANVLKKLDVKKGDRVGIYLPMIPEVQIAMLACARIGAIHSVVFSAFSSKSLQGRLIDAEAKVLVTSDGYYRKGREENLKAKADEGVKETKVKKVVVVKRTGAKVPMKKGRDYYWNELMEKAEDYYKPAVMNSEDVLFILYTSGTTGKPKGVIHDTGGYLTQAYWTAKWDFDLHDEDIFWSTADIGWITGHTYSCYGTLANGATMVIYEGQPTYPEPDRCWKIIKKHGVTIFYTAPTLIRMLMELGDKWVKRYHLNTLRILGVVGEPCNDEAWLWYFKNVGGGRCPVIDTWWQTETGGTLIQPLPGIGPFIPESATKSFPGTLADIFDPESPKPLSKNKNGFLVFKGPFPPGMLRGVWKNPKKYLDTYWSKYGKKIYFTDDGAYRDQNGYIRITGRVDDVMKVAGHRLANAELESAIESHKNVAEAAVIGKPHKIKGEVPLAFVIVNRGVKPSKKLKVELIKQVDKEIGPTARPEDIIFVKEVPKTRSGKIMRRILKRMIKGEELGDITTLQNPDCVEVLKKVVGYKPKK